jgi:fumarate reductase subunit C
MIEGSAYTEFRPKWYRTRVSTYWWLSQWSYTKFILRELSSVFVGYFIVITLLQVRALTLGASSYAELQDWLGNPLVILLNSVGFLFLLLHTVTWFNLTPRAIVLRLGGKRVPDILIIAPNYVAWLVISGVLAWIIVGG